MALPKSGGLTPPKKASTTGGMTPPRMKPMTPTGGLTPPKRISSGGTMTTQKRIPGSGLAPSKTSPKFVPPSKPMPMPKTNMAQKTNAMNALKGNMAKVNAMRSTAPKLVKKGV